MKRITKLLSKITPVNVIVLFVVLVFSFIFVQNYYTKKLPEFTLVELSRFDGKNGRPAYFVYDGKVYDVTKSKAWKNGIHPGQHAAGQDLTEKLIGAPHGVEVFKKFPTVGFVKP